MELPAEPLVTGRRIYVHEHSFRALGAAGAEEAEAVRLLLSESWVFRVAVHHIGSDRLVGYLSRDQEQQLIDGLRDRYRRVCSPLLGAMLMRTTRGTVPLLAAGESLHATCFDSGYYTFATDFASACRMYDDTLPLRSLYSAVACGAGDPDLTMVRGRRLIWVGVGRTLAQPEATSIPATAPVSERLELALAAGRRQAERRLDSLLAK